MKRRIRYYFLILALLPVGMRAEITPLETAKRVADKVIRDARFHYNLKVATSEDFGETQTLDFSRNFSERGVAYALTTIIVQKDTIVSLGIGNQGDCKIILNGKEIWVKSDMKDNALLFIERDVKVGGELLLPLKTGINRLLIKSISPMQGKWRIYLRPSGLHFTLKGLDKVDQSVIQLSAWLMAGAFPEDTFHSIQSIEEEFDPGALYPGIDGNPVTWILPRIEMVTANAEVHQPWGEGYTAFNYHAGGVAWAMEHLGAYTHLQKYTDYCKTYCDFYIDKRPYLARQKYEMNAFNAYDNRVVESFLLDFTASPLLPFTERLLTGSETAKRDKYLSLFEEIKEYVLHRQIRTPEGAFMRETPLKHTVWSDDMYMGIPFLVQAARLTTDAAQQEAIFNDAANQVFSFNSYVFNRKDGLYQHAQYTGERVVQPYWSRANGWALWAVTHLLSYLPEQHPHYRKLLKHYRTHVKALINHQDASGLWRNVINHKEAYPETSGTAIFAYCMAKGILNGWIPGKTYTPVVLKAWKGVESMIGPEGEVKNICIGTMCSTNINDYLERPVCTNDTHGLFPVIFAAIEIDKLLKTEEP